MAARSAEEGADALGESKLTLASESEPFSRASDESSSTSSGPPVVLYRRPTMWSMLRTVAINLLLPFVNGMMLGFGELFAHEAAFRLGWSGTKVSRRLGEDGDGAEGDAIADGAPYRRSFPLPGEEPIPWARGSRWASAEREPKTNDEGRLEEGTTRSWRKPTRTSSVSTGGFDWRLLAQGKQICMHACIIGE